MGARRCLDAEDAVATAKAGRRVSTCKASAETELTLYHVPIVQAIASCVAREATSIPTGYRKPLLFAVPLI